MPTYTYQCQKCDQPMQVYHSITVSPKVKCGSCGSSRMKRLLGTGAGILFKGSGFYETDYKRNGGGKPETPGGESKPDAKADAKIESKSESKSGGTETGKTKTAAKTAL
jgi:putative FmdB family regulatory protein